MGRHGRRTQPPARRRPPSGGRSPRTPRPLAEVIAAANGAPRANARTRPSTVSRVAFGSPCAGRRACSRARRWSGRLYRITDARHDPRVHPDWEGRLDVDEFACAPLVAKGKVVGVLVVDNKFNGKPITDEDLEFLAAFATQAGLTVENARVYTSLEDANREIQRSHHRLLQQERLAALGRDGRPRGARDPQPAGGDRRICSPAGAASGKGASRRGSTPRSSRGRRTGWSGSCRTCAACRARAGSP
ncbi:MAG: GAF domain-containing protein [Ignavibacteriales bacterium]|nr:GAF domain-containing protein [Ignavibacteriales bacterium]